jgi:hypothetical protein
LRLPASPGSSELDAQEHDLELSEAELFAALEPRATPPLSAPTSSEAAQPGSPSTGGGAAAPPRSAPRPSEAAKPKRSADDVGARCELGCRAFGSMQRSADAICRLTTTSDARCSRARERVGAALERLSVRGCQCQT